MVRRISRGFDAMAELARWSVRNHMGHNEKSMSFLIRVSNQRTNDAQCRIATSHVAAFW